MNEPLVGGDAVFLAGLLLVAAGAAIAGVGLQARQRARGGVLQRRLLLIAADRSGADEGLSLETTTTTAGGLRGRLLRLLRRSHMRAGGAAGLRVALLWGAAAAGAVGGIAHALFQLDEPVTVCLAVAVAIVAFNSKIRVLEHNRNEEFLNHLPEAIELVVRAAQAGIPVTEAIALAGREVVGPVGETFRAVAERIQLGIELKDALQEAAERVDLVDFDCFVVSLLVQRETGGQLAETLGNLATLIRRRKETREKARALTAEGRLTAKVIAAIPVGISAFLAIANPSYMAVLTTDPTGRLALMVATGCVIVGLLVITRLTRPEL